VQLDSSAGSPPIKQVTHPGTQGAGVIGMHGAGENITGGGLTVAGLAGFVHMAKGKIFTIET